MILTESSCWHYIFCVSRLLQIQVYFKFLELAKYCTNRNMVTVCTSAGIYNNCWSYEKWNMYEIWVFKIDSANNHMPKEGHRLKEIFFCSHVINSANWFSDTLDNIYHLLQNESWLNAMSYNLDKIELWLQVCQDTVTCPLACLEHKTYRKPVNHWNTVTIPSLWAGAHWWNVRVLQADLHPALFAK